ncbi:hypothetical protein [Spirochaeta isovalerica]|uniref:Lipoprotein n=1 Tax=Spirochaeta isovalerica TaxID=150 RepID=A0A841RFG7_9SPIO|nr:hypothetical protein [Spirochaeta isovalerica]MBB6482723.1 hypothetical protein [Spirochaeta isovalerica]
MKFKIKLLALCIVIFLVLGCENGNTDVNLTFDEIFKLEAKSYSFIDTDYYADSIIDNRGYMFVPTENDTINIYNASDLEFINSISFISNVSSSSIGNPIAKLITENDQLIFSGWSDIYFYDISDINDISLIERDLLERAEDTDGIYDFVKIGDYIYAPTSSGLNIYQWNSNIFTFIGTSSVTLTPDEQFSNNSSRILSYNNFLYYFSYNSSDNSLQRVVTFDITDDAENPVILSNRTDIEFEHLNLSMTENYFISCFTNTITIYEINTDGTLNQVYRGEPHINEGSSLKEDLFVGSWADYIIDYSQKDQPVLLSSFSYTVPEHLRILRQNDIYYFFEVINNFSGEYKQDVSIRKYSIVQ